MFYLLSIMLFVKEINLIVAVGFLAMYLIYVILVVVQSKQVGDETPEEQKKNE